MMMMMKNKRQSMFQREMLAMLVAFLVVVGSLALQAGQTLTNGLSPIVGKTFRLALISSREAGHEDLRSFEKLADSLKKVENQFLKWGIALDRPVRIMLYADTDFPARDFWVAAGVPPTPESIKEFEDDNSLLNACMSGYEMAHQLDLFLYKWYFLNAELMPKKYLGSPQKFPTEDLTGLVKAIKNHCQRIQSSLNKPASECSNDYIFFAEPAYCFPYGVIWVPVRKTGSLHRQLNTIVHEFGHLLFFQLVTSVVNKNKAQKNWTRLQLASTVDSLLAINEFFADFCAVANEYDMNISLHNFAKYQLPKEIKRSFSQDRTLASYLNDINTTPRKDIKFLLEEGHNSLNPSRTFVWKLNLAFGDSTNEKLVITAIRNYVHHFFAKVVPNSKRIPAKHGWGCFYIDGYPVDVRTENLRFLEYLQEASKQVLNAKQQEIFAKEAAKIFGNEYPLKQSFR